MFVMQRVLRLREGVGIAMVSTSIGKGWVMSTIEQQEHRITAKEVDHRFAPRRGDPNAQRTQSGYATLAHQLADHLPDGREKAAAITKLEESMFWATAAVARDSS